MHRQSLLRALAAYHPDDADEAQSLHRLRTFVEDTATCFDRTHHAGHVTGSGLLLHAADGKFLLNHHASLQKWLCFGGHADGEDDVEAVARRETMEESGITALDLLLPGIFDIDVHDIPENPRKNEPAHFHYDIAYLYNTVERDWKISDESLELRWFTPADGLAISDDRRLRRMLKKAQQFIKGNA